MTVKSLISNSFFLVAVCIAALFFHSCSKDDVTDTPVSIEESVSNADSDIVEDRDAPPRDGFKDFNNLFATPQSYQELKGELNRELSLFNDLEALADRYDGTSLDFSYMNSYLKYVGKAQINIKQYIIQGRAIINDKNSTVQDFTRFLSSYNLFNQEQLDLFVKFDANFAQVTDLKGYKKAVASLENEIYNSQKLNLIERNTMLMYAGIMSSFSTTDYIAKAAGPCKDCIKKNKRKIFGWGAFWALLAVIGCIAATFGALIPACIVGILGTGVLATLKMYCGSVCSWI